MERWPFEFDLIIFILLLMIKYNPIIKVKESIYFLLRNLDKLLKFQLLLSFP